MEGVAHVLEKRHWGAERAEKGRRELVFRNYVAFVIVVLISNFMHPGEIAGDDNECTHEDSKEGQAVFAQVESVDFYKDNWVGFELDVQNS
jgi:hypothetical protein